MESLRKLVSVPLLASGALGFWLLPFASGQTLATKFHGEDADDLAGGAVAIEGNTAVVGASRAHGSAVSGDGAAYVLRRSGPTWPATTVSAGCIELAPPASIYTETFGSSVALSGSLVVVGEPEMNSGGATDNGAAYVYFDDGVTVVFEAELVPSTTTNTRSGESVAASGDLVAVGAPGDFAFAPDPGSVAIYRRDVAVPHFGAPEATLTGPAGMTGDRFGFAVALDGTRCIVGAPNRDAAAADAGAAYAFVRTAGGWVFDGELVPSVAPAGAAFGVSVDVQADLALVGASGDDAAYVFRRISPGVWQQQARLTGVEPAALESFGYSVAISGDRLVVGAIGRDVAHVFRRVGPMQWKRSQRLQEQFTDGMAASVAISGLAVAIGAPLDDDAGNDAGAVAFFDSPDWADAYAFGEAGTCPCLNDSPYTGCGNSTGTGALLRVEGSNHIAANDLVLSVSRMPAARPCVGFMGDGAGFNVFGSGRRGVFPGPEGFARLLPAGMSSGAGTYVIGPGMGGIYPPFAAMVSPGETWNFQCWYRDAVHGACVVQTNLSNAVSVSFVP